MSNGDRKPMQRGGTTAPKGRLTYGNQSWVVESEPEVVEVEKGLRLVEVWVTEEGEDGGESS
ncbi:hypothetical protein AB0K92_15950 [Streptomyces sp. NPDC052687]|uniref:hypothetical protein n=1 Tax=Streptomyces sp. NPDC052687 TaxID=3154759 RepID=UPI003430AE4B